jgi:hypothetical protein
LRHKSRWLTIDIGKRLHHGRTHPRAHTSAHHLGRIRGGKSNRTHDVRHSKTDTSLIAWHYWSARHFDDLKKSFNALSTALTHRPLKFRMMC